MIFLRKSEVLRIHERAIAEFGGAEGILNEGGLESALVAAENRGYYEEAGIAVCAATYAFHVTKAHAFVDGNKRTAAAVTEVFVVLNGARVSATDDDFYGLIVGIAAGEISRAAAEEWFEKRTVLTDP